MILAVAGLPATRLDASAGLADSAPGAFDNLLTHLPAPQRHFESGSAADWRDWLDLHGNFRALQRERREGRWFAALLSNTPGRRLAIEQRFESATTFDRFLADHQPIVDLWIRTATGPPGARRPGQRRLTAVELADLGHDAQSLPTWITVTCPDATGAVTTWRVEFGLATAAQAQAALQAYDRQRSHLNRVRNILATRDANGRLNALAQWQALHGALRQGELDLDHLPVPPTTEHDLYVAAEYAVDDRGSFHHFVRLYRESEIERDLRGGTQRLLLRPSWERTEFEAHPFTRSVGQDALQPVITLPPGQEAVELRVLNHLERDPRRWNVLEFGEPEILRETALARYGLVNACLDRRRKQLAWRKNTLDLYAEPAIAALNIGAGLASFGFPLGEAARLAYNLFASPPLLGSMPRADEIRDLVLLLAAHQHDAKLARKAARWLTPEDLDYLKRQLAALPPAQIRDTVDALCPDDFDALASYARLQGIDARYRLFVDVLSSAAKLSDTTDDNFLRTLLDNPYFALNGDLSIKNVIAAMVGERHAIFPYGVPLDHLADGEGGLVDWLQFFNLSVDVRALANTIHRLRTEDLAIRELRQPFPYAPRLSDLAAYEIRVFGYPVLLYYKRGLLKADIAAYDNDYAYSVLGTRIVEHFASREDLDREIRARRVVPLGYVKVLDPSGRLRDSRLAVFARLFPSGPEQGRTGLVLYGLKAYADYSALMDRELQRFRDYEQLLRQGGVIERVIDADDRATLPAATFEPTLHRGPEARFTLFSRPLAALRELERHARRQQWGLEPSPEDVPLVARLRQRLQDEGLDPGNDTTAPHLEVAPHGGTFRFRQQVNRAWRTVERTAIAGPDDLRLALRTTRTAAEIEQARRATASAQAGPLLLLNQAVPEEDRLRMGPLLRTADGHVIGAGLRQDADALAQLWTALERLPLVARAAAQAGHLAGLPLDLDADHDGHPETVFVTVEYPGGDEVLTRHLQAASGETEMLWFHDGLCRQATTPRRLTEFTHDPFRQEATSRTYENTGSLEEPRRGQIIEESFSLEYWFRDPTQPAPDPSQPVLTKLRLNHITGEVSLETYGLYSRPVRSVDDLWITENQFTDRGFLDKARLWHNGNDPLDFQRPLLEKLLHPVPGRERFLLRALATPNAGTNPATAERIDLLKGLTNILYFDPKHHGRKTGEWFVDPFDGTRFFSTRTTNHYRDDFHGGLVPYRSERRDLTTDTLLTTVTIVGFNPTRRELTGWEVDHTGKTNLTVWSAQWDNPIRVQSDLRGTEYTYDPWEMTFQGRTFTRDTEEELSRYQGAFDTHRRLWRVQRLLWYRPGVTNWTEEAWFSPGGRRLTTRAGGVWETRSLYDARGLLVTNLLAYTNSATGAFDQISRLESDFHWLNGACDARVQTFVDGRPHDEFRSLTDPEGRVVRDSMRSLPGLRFHSESTYEGATDRVREARDYQNGRLRLTRSVLPDLVDADGRHSVPTILRPEWGLVTTQLFLLGEAWGRPSTTRLENGNTLVVREWFNGTRIPRITEVTDRHRRPLERRITDLLDDLSAGLPCDRTRRYLLGPGGTSGLADTEFTIRGTGVPARRIAGDRELVFDLDAPFPAPLYALDPERLAGVTVRIDDRPVSHLLALFDTRTNTLPASGTDPPQPGLSQLEVDLRPLLYHRVVRRSLDRQGAVLEESTGRLPNQGVPARRSPLLTAAANTPSLRRFTYFYEPGWLVELANSDGQPAEWLFTRSSPPATATAWPVNDQGHRDFISTVEGFRAPANASLTTNTAPPPAQAPWLFRKLEAPRLLHANPHLPGQTNCWTTWTARDLDRNGNLLQESRHYYDSQGRLRTARTVKQTATGEPAIRTVYYADPDEAPFTPLDLSTPAARADLPMPSSPDWSRFDFVAWQVEPPAGSQLALLLTDTHGRTARVGPGRSQLVRRQLALWIPDPTSQLWLPNDSVPRQVTALRANSARLLRQPLFIVSVHELEAAGLDVRQIRSAQLAGHADAAPPGRLACSPALAFQRDGPFVPWSQPRDQRRTAHVRSPGLVQLESTSLPEDDEDLMGNRSASTFLFGGLPLASTHQPPRPSPHPTLLFFDQSDAESPRPLYAVLSQDGHLLEHYRTTDLGDALQLYTIVNGLEIPRFDVFHRDILVEELAPGFMSYGYDYHARVHYQKARPGLGNTLARLRNRVAANSFNYYGDLVASNLWTELVPPAHRPQYDYAQLHAAPAQADAVQSMPSIAQALIAFREPAAPPTGTNLPALPTIDWRALRINLLTTHVYSFTNNRTLFYDATYLIPTAPDTAAAPYVDTVAEADLILLAIDLGELGLAGDLLEFYRLNFRDRGEPLHASYDAWTGTAMTLEYGPARPMQSRPTALAQIAIAEAAFDLARHTASAHWAAFGRDLLDLALARFRGSETNESPRGFTHYRALQRRAVLGLTLWPSDDRYPVGLNARAFLLLHRLAQDDATLALIPGWTETCRTALAEQEAWLRTQLLPRVEQSGLVPSALFEIQYVQGNSSALAAERWTSADDWLLFLEAAHALALPPTRLHEWLDHLLRVHGVEIDGAPGLDPGLPLLRPPAIPATTTARLLHLGRLLQHTNAIRIATAGLARLHRDGSLAALLTTASPQHPFRSGTGPIIYPRTDGSGWPDALAAYRHILAATRPVTANPRPQAPALAPPAAAPLNREDADRPWTDRFALTDLMVFVLLTGTFYVCILLIALFWWRFRRLRPKETANLDEALMPEAALQLAEERWARRVLGTQTPARASHTRFSNATLEQNFVLQLRALHKMVVEWRRQENGWAEDDPRIAEDDSDEWLNGIDEFASIIGIYMRHVIKAGAKDGFPQADVLLENEDGNHIWSRMVMYLAEYYWGMFTLLRDYNRVVLHQDKANLYGEITRLLQSLGVRERTTGFDARQLFNFPANPAAFDLLIVQRPGITLSKVLMEASLRLRVPYSHLVTIIERYKTFKRREALDPIHPYLVEFAKVLPHFLLMGLGALVWYNQQTLADSPIVPYLWFQLVGLTRHWTTLVWAVPLALGALLTAAGQFVRIYRFDASMLPRERTTSFLEERLTTILGKKHSPMPEIRPGRLWNPLPYEWTGWSCRALGCLLLALALFNWPTPSFATFLIVKGILAMLALMEAAGIVLPLASTLAAKSLQDHLSRRPRTSGLLHLLNRLNFSATRPASPLWLGLRYLTQPSVPSGTPLTLIQAVAAYFGLAALFFFVGGFLCQQILSLWFTETYLNASNLKLVIGGLVFWNTMYLLRYGLFLLATSFASLLATWPFRTFAALAGLAHLTLIVATPDLSRQLPAFAPAAWIVTALLLALALAEEPVRAALRQLGRRHHRKAPSPVQRQQDLDRLRQDPHAKVGIVYMSGDDLSALKLNPDLLMSRWQLLRDKFGSSGLDLLHGLADRPNDATLRRWFTDLFELEQKHRVTLWHPLQLTVAGSAPLVPPATASPDTLPLAPDLHLVAASLEHRRTLLLAWHIRRWLVTMMSTAGHSQDTAVNLVDIALRLHQERLAQNSVVYLIQNKYDDRDNNRPVQLRYDEGELLHRDKLARLLEFLAPGLNAWSVQNWTPFGFKAGGMTGMDLVPEEILRLRTMVVLDRNATINDPDAFLEDLTEALLDPNLVIVIPGRGTTNTLTDLGQGSQMIEEGHRSFLKGLMRWLGGEASEAIGTGWGNIVACTYGRVTRAMLDPVTPKMPLTSRMQRGSSFAVRTEGLIGFAPHAVGISEDTWAVSQAAHNLVALGGRVRFRLSRAMWHKIRETWSHAEWLASFPRWSGGYLQMMQDTLMQRINDFGPLSVFARELRAFSGRCYLSAPFALFNILFLPLAIIWDVTPFVQILIILWNFGFVMNQVLTLHGLNAYLESAGFSRTGTLLGAAFSAAVTLAHPDLHLYAPALVLLASFVGGAWTGLSRWAYTRLRDVILFGPQLILHTLGQVMRQTIEFVTSGAAANDAQGVNMAWRAWAGPREDQPLASYPHFLNLRTVVWIVGVPSVLLNLLALSNLDMFNVVLLLPSLLFSASVMAGPFLMTPRKGHESPAAVRLTKWIAWPAAFVFYAVVSMLVAQGGPSQAVGLLLALGLLALVAASPTQHLFHPWKLRRAQRRLAAKLQTAGVPADVAQHAFPALAQVASDPAKLEAQLASMNVPEPARPAIATLAHLRLPSLLTAGKLPAPTRPPRLDRLVAEFRRSFALALLTQLWFLVVPVPGLFVFAAGDYRTSMTLTAIMAIVVALSLLAIASHRLTEALRSLRRRLPLSPNLEARAHAAFRQLQDAAATPGRLPNADLARLFALFTDLKTYFDQRADHYAHQCLRRIEIALLERPAER